MRNYPNPFNKFKVWGPSVLAHGYWIICALVLAGLVIYSTPAAANVFGSAWHGITGALGAISIRAVVEVVFAVLAVFGLAKWAQWKTVATEGIEFALDMRSAVAVGGPGGKTITPAEMEHLLKEGGDFGRAVLAAVAARAPR